MAQILVLSSANGSDALVALSLLSHRVRVIPASPGQLVRAPDGDLIFIDARNNLVAAKTLCQILRTAGLSVPLIPVVTEGGLVAITPDWSVDDVIIDSAGPAEIETRIRLALGRAPHGGPPVANPSRIQASGVVIDELSYSAKVEGASLNLTYKEFELLRFLAAHPARVFTRDQILSEVWGFDYFGGTRTVDVHVRRLRAKLGDREHLIGTVRNIGYRFNASEEDVLEPTLTH